MAEGLDRSAAVTRSLLGWGVVAGPFYVVVGLVLALTRPGFDLSRHALSLLELGDLGWLQRTNLVLTGLMVLTAAYGLIRAIRNGRGLAMGVLVAIFGVSLLLSAIVGPDPVDGFPPGSTATATVSGILHILFGALGFAGLVGAAFAYASWARSIGAGSRQTIGMLFGVGIAATFLSGAALATSVIGIVLLWLAVLGGFTFLALACSHVYAWSPHPVLAQRTAAESAP